MAIYIFTDTLAFNLLMGLGWLPGPEDYKTAMEICDALALGDLVRRMPLGLDQLVGETGWQLSHGGASRVFLARALLQRAELVVLDESFAALDCEVLAQSLEATRRLAPSVVVAHP